MEKYSPRVDKYIENSPDFAKPILSYLRQTVHEFCLDAEEAIKWKFPTFMYKGKTLCSVTPFKQYCSMGFWLHDEMKTIKNPKTNAEKNNMFSLGKIKNPEDPSLKIQLKNSILEAMELTDMYITMKKATLSKPEINAPEYFQNALKENKQALAFFEKASSSFRKEYVLWITDTKTETTRNKRMEQALEWMAEGKGRSWKYEKK